MVGMLHKMACCMTDVASMRDMTREDDQRAREVARDAAVADAFEALIKRGRVSLSTMCDVERLTRLINASEQRLQTPVEGIDVVRLVCRFLADAIERDPTGLDGIPRRDPASQ
jgi:hypothetical protein